MKIVGLATDYDGTLAEDGIVSNTTIKALEQLRSSGKKTILVTGRELEELLMVFPQIDLFDKVVAENGALLYSPKIKDKRLLSQQPSSKLVNLLKERGIKRISVGRSIIATWRPWEDIVLDSIRDLGLELQVIFNKDAVMILPSGVNKSTGLTEALKELELNPANIAGVGDAENDHTFLKMCGYSAAVSNAIESLKQEVDLQLTNPRGKGVEELIRKILNNEIK